MKVRSGMWQTSSIEAKTKASKVDHARRRIPLYVQTKIIVTLAFSLLLYLVLVYSSRNPLQNYFLFLDAHTG